MRTAILVHGVPGREEYYDTAQPSASNAHWFPWLQNELLVRGVAAATPEMPLAYAPEYDIWRREFERFDLRDDTILVGHSCGGGFLVRWLSEHPAVSVGPVVLVAPWLDPRREATTDFFDFTMDSHLPTRASEAVIFASDNDHDSVTETRRCCAGPCLRRGGASSPATVTSAAPARRPRSRPRRSTERTRGATRAGPDPGRAHRRRTARPPGQHGPGHRPRRGMSRKAGTLQAPAGHTCAPFGAPTTAGIRARAVQRRCRLTPSRGGREVAHQRGAARRRAVRPGRGGRGRRCSAPDAGAGAAYPRPGGGLAGIRDRVEALGGGLIIGADDPCGSVISVELPAGRA